MANFRLITFVSFWHGNSFWVKKYLPMANPIIGVFVDDRIEQTIYERTFQKLEHKMQGFVFTSPEEGIARANEIEFDIVFIEINFWGENFGGISILDQLKRISGKNITAIAMTSLLQAGDWEKITKAGFFMCLEKPISFDLFKMFSGVVCYN